MNRHSKPVCRSILFALVLSVSFASSGEPSAQAVADARVACASDIQKLCAGVSPGGGRIVACLKQHQQEVSDGCRRAVLAAMQPQSKAGKASNSGERYYRMKQVKLIDQAAGQGKPAYDLMIISKLQAQVADTINAVVTNQQQGSYASAAGADRLIRGVQVFRDPSSGASFELSNQYDHAWLNGSNECVMSDDPNFTPNGNLDGNWTQLQPVR
jgi:hypothetical protein